MVVSRDTVRLGHTLILQGGLEDHALGKLINVLSEEVLPWVQDVQVRWE